ncbi:hypothetical protein [Streptomyces triticiradicis]|uniref:Uncharacterized protein n=1 Tax=Streptomyces triticiradicis TaxID=2651189 RepID=A0A7J5DHW5_9ACTN|nr:hypothetical protein [Streptomyces triticiradicis]KAB1988255.1 hypothetical protein F8144_13650 [Streptomyces triticiradicis]
MSDTPVVERVDTAVFTVPTDAPEADGTLTRDSTTLVLAEVYCGPVTGLGYTCAPAAPAGPDGPVNRLRAPARPRSPSATTPATRQGVDT